MKCGWKEITKHFYEQAKWKGLRYCGIPIGKNPLDLWVYQEVIEEVKPALIIEFGTWFGGSTLWFAHQLDRLKSGDVPAHVVSVEKSTRHKAAFPVHSRISYIEGGGLDDAVVQRITEWVAQTPGPVLIVEDSCHRYRHVRPSLERYHSLVTVGSYFVVEDTGLELCLGNKTRNAWSAVQDFLRCHPEFKADLGREKFGITFHPGGFLKRMR